MKNTRSGTSTDMTEYLSKLKYIHYQYKSKEPNLYTSEFFIRLKDRIDHPDEVMDSRDFFI
jgi:hypothetical protein